MSKWEDSFKKTITHSNDDFVCSCSSGQGLFIPNRQLSAVIAGLLFIFFSIFISGYFLGKKYAVTEFVQEIRQDSIADGVYASLLSTANEDEKKDEDCLLSASAQPNILLQEVAVAQETFPSQSFYAQLIGFGTEKAAQQFVTKLSAKGFDVEVKKRTSKTAKGRTSFWYQVVTKPYADKGELAVVVDRIAKEENIKDVNIRVC